MGLTATELGAGGGGGGGGGLGLVPPEQPRPSAATSASSVHVMIPPWSLRVRTKGEAYLQRRLPPPQLAPRPALAKNRAASYQPVATRGPWNIAVRGAHANYREGRGCRRRRADIRDPESGLQRLAWRRSGLNLDIGSIGGAAAGPLTPSTPKDPTPSPICHRLRTAPLCPNAGVQAATPVMASLSSTAGTPHCFRDDNSFRQQSPWRGVRSGEPAAGRIEKWLIG